MFGHSISMNFNKRGASHKTHIGGFFSIFIKVLIRAYVLLNFKTMFWYEANKNKSYSELKKINELGQVNYNQTDL
jgi:hypothetical protein